MFEKIDIGIKTFLRDEHLFHAIRGIQLNYPEARMIIVDDGDMTEEKDGLYADLTRAGHITDILPFDSGFGKKSNRVVELSTRPYILVGSDDFEFSEQAANGLYSLQVTLDDNDDVDIASGRVNHRPYEFFLNVRYGPLGIFVEESPVTKMRNSWYMDCDLTVNYSLIRRDHLKAAGIAWDNDVKIGGGEHGAFFYDCKLAGLKTAYVPGVNINEQRFPASPRYKTYRSRASSPERPCFDRRGISEYILGDGRIDYKRV